MRKWCVIALVTSVCITAGAALWNLAPSDGANIGAGVLFLLGGVCTLVVSVFCLRGSSRPAESPGATNQDDEATS